MAKVLRLRKAGFTLIELMIVVAIVGVLAVLAIYGVRKYIANSKTAEAKNALGEIGKQAQAALEREQMSSAVLAPNSSAGLSRRLCESAGAAVPSAPGSIQGKKYQSNPAQGNDYNLDCTTSALAPGGPKGFCCLRFEMAAPQYYQYNYQADPSATSPGSAMTATAIGDLNGDGVYSTFQLYGAITSASANQLLLAPTLYENQPEE